MTTRKAKPPLRFAAIDFETADYGRDSACAVAAVLSDGAKILDKREYLIRPPRREFFFSYLHGITWRDVRNKPEFRELWKGELSKFLGAADFFVAHNASFDKGVLHTCCDEAGHRPPKTQFLCTMKLARQCWGIYPTKLSDVCRKLKIPLKHHNAASDAIACAHIVHKAIDTGYDIWGMIDKGKTRRKNPA
jgi:DNA polymerase-3 subunit epsilon